MNVGEGEPRRIVIVGHGMAGARFVQELRTRDVAGRFEIVALGAEADAAYNRVLLSSVLAGSLAPDDVRLLPGNWYADEGVTLRTGVTVSHIDREARQVVLADGETIGYDHVVMATGSEPWVPPIDGLTDPATQELADGVTVFRTLQDCRDILGQLGKVQRAVVLGGGLLGLEAARGLAGRGLEVEVVHAADQLMERQLDGDAGRVLSRTLRGLGVKVRLDAGAERYENRTLVMGDGTRVAADLVVVACGVRPRVELAQSAGVAVGRGVIVDDRLTSVTDARIHAIGECAQHGDQTYGLVAPAWEQAAVLADVLTGGELRYTGSQIVTRLKAADVDLAAMGEVEADDFDEDVEVIRFADPARGTYKKVVIRDERVTGAIMLGGGETVGTVTQLFDRGGLVPLDRRELIFPGLADGASSDPASMPDDEVVCRCNGVTAGHIRAACRDGAESVGDVALCTRATTGCGGCRDTVAGLVASQSEVEVVVA